MRWLFAGATALFLLWAAYVASPYITLIRFATALASVDVPEIAERINLRAIRIALAKQLVGEGLAGKAATALGSSESELAKATVALAADPFLEALVTTEGVAGLLGDADVESLGAAGQPGVIERLRGVARTIASLATTSRWRGFRNVYFTVPPERSPESQVRLQFRLSRLSWRLVGIDLSAAQRTRLVDEIVRTRSPIVK